MREVKIEIIKDCLSRQHVRFILSKDLFYVILIIIHATLHCQLDHPFTTKEFKQTNFRRRWGRYTFRKIRNVLADLILTWHAKGGVRRDALYASTYTSHFTSFCSLALHGTSVFRLNALRVIKWFFSSHEQRRSMENAFSKMWMLAHNDYYVATCNCLCENFCVFRRTCRRVSHAEERMFNPLHLSLYRLTGIISLRNYAVVNAFIYRDLSDQHCSAVYQ